MTMASSARRDDVEVLFDEQDRHDLRGLLKGVGDFADDLRGEALRRLVDQQDAVVVEQRARDRHHLLLATGERSRELRPPRHEVGEELGDELAARLLSRSARARFSATVRPANTSRSSGT
jgi:hypothetical protein